MKSEELRALGLDKDTIRKVQRIHAEDFKKLHQKINPNHKEKIRQLRDGIDKMVTLLEETYSLRQVLATATHYYHREMMAEKKAKTAQKGGESMAYYTECPQCGDKLDPGEKCDCQKEPKAAQEEATKVNEK